MWYAINIGAVVYAVGYAAYKVYTERKRTCVWPKHGQSHRSYWSNKRC